MLRNDRHDANGHRVRLGKISRNELNATVSEGHWTAAFRESLSSLATTKVAPVAPTPLQRLVEFGPIIPLTTLDLNCIRAAQSGE